MTETKTWQDASLPCPDPDCVDAESGKHSVAEPGSDEELQYHECVTCGYEFNWVRVAESVGFSSDGGNCQVGIPEAIRRMGSGLAEQAMQKLDDQKPMLQIGKRPPDVV